MRITHHTIDVDTEHGIALHDITGEVQASARETGVASGFLILNSPHTTTGLVINEKETRLLEDVKRFFERLVPEGGEYLHNDIHLRDCPPDEPRNAHSHLLAMLLGNSIVIPIIDGRLGLGRWQSIFLVELDGPRPRKVNLQFFG